MSERVSFKKVKSCNLLPKECTPEIENRKVPSQCGEYEKSGNTSFGTSIMQHGTLCRDRSYLVRRSRILHTLEL